jgi:anti-sigma B factor antagonist
MAIAIEELPGGITKVALDGKLDIEGSAAVDLQMNIIAGSHKIVLVDLRNVTYLGSMGLRLLVEPAQAIRSRGGKMLIYGPNEMVERALKTACVDTLIPVHHDLQSALDALKQ